MGKYDKPAYLCEYPNCMRRTEYKAEGKYAMCSEHHALYIFIKDHFVLKEIKKSKKEQILKALNKPVSDIDIKELSKDIKMPKPKSRWHIEKVGE